MASVSQLSKLFKAVAAGDLQRAQNAASDISDAEERIGHHGAAQQLRGSLRPNGTRGATGTNGTNGAHHDARAVMLADALTPVSTGLELASVRLRRVARVAVQELLSEWEHRDHLAKSGVPRRTRLLFYGPPGCGKSLTACALGKELSLPVFVVRFDAVIGSYLGQTALHLRELFRFAESTPCVLLIDEIDALGKRRGDPLDVGELHRIAITLMQELEHANPQGYLVATSNLPRQLDLALWRRFDLVLEFPRPAKREIEEYASSLAGMRRLKLSAGLHAKLRKAASYAEAENIIEGEARRKILAALVKP
jgi:ATP-dependent Zn protease